MPIYQYDCGDCGRRVELFFRSISRVAEASCPECGSAQLTRAVSQIARSRSLREAIEGIDIGQELGRLDGRDEASFAKWARRMGEQYDDSLGTDFGELARSADAGLDPSERVDPAFALTNRIQRAKERLAGDETGGE